ncbi:MAG TPA: MJ0042-type zinc finger domain-containing protein, partial [Steroidobacteraceae bacterium]|nr:MJ0042-type zinc finger domain-containing protein [Steroidobacteraceae bacterium]
MYTQCSKCETVFQLSAETLRAAGGQVRCGRCGEEFNALARLAEEVTDFPPGESALESETRADAILHSPAPSSSAAAPVPESEPVGEGNEIAHLRLLDAPDEEFDFEPSLEFTLPPGELDRIFIETSPSQLQLLAASVKASAAQGAPPPAAAARPEPIADPAPQAAFDQSESKPAGSVAAPPISAPDISQSTPARSDVPAAGIPGLEVADDVRREMLASYRRAELPEINALRRRQLPSAVWVSAAV